MIYPFAQMRVLQESSEFVAIGTPETAPDATLENPFVAHLLPVPWRTARPQPSNRSRSGSHPSQPWSPARGNLALHRCQLRDNLCDLFAFRSCSCRHAHQRAFGFVTAGPNRHQRIMRRVSVDGSKRGCEAPRYSGDHGVSQTCNYRMVSIRPQYRRA